jgi:hypothetical protein
MVSIPFVGPRGRIYVIMATLGVLFLAIAVIVARVWHSQSEARKLLEEVASFELDRSTAADVRLFEERFRTYEVASKQTGKENFVRFVITNQPLAALKLEPLAAVTAGIYTRDGKVVGVGLSLERQVGRGSRAAFVEESVRHQALYCNQPYCVGNPIGKPFVSIRVDGRATVEPKKRAFNLDLSWLTRFRGEPRICDLSPNAWEDWKAQMPKSVSALQDTYHCP